MKAWAAWALLLGSTLAPLVLLWMGGRLHRRTPGTQAAFRGGALGFLLAVVLVTALLVTGPHHWPPASGIRLWGVVLGVPLLTLLGAFWSALADRG